MQTFDIQTIEEGERFAFTKTLTSQDLDLFIQLSGDINPLHVDENFALKRGFRGRVVHGFYLMGLVSKLVGVYLPGRNAFIQKENATFHAPTYIGDTIEVSGLVIQKSTAAGIVVLEFEISEKTYGERRVTGKVEIGFTKENM